MKRVCVVTGSRVEYGLLRWVMQGLKDSPRCELLTIVTGMHLAPHFGETWRDIGSDGFAIDWKVEMLLVSDSSVGETKTMGLAMVGFADAYRRLAPDLVVLLGDRFEIFAAASAALIAGIPIAHLHGGEVTEGAFDDAIRHAVTKMAHLHFTATERYSRRVMQMGEDPARVWNVGGFGLDGIARLEPLGRKALEESSGMTLGERSLMVIFHPETASGAQPAAQMAELLAAIEACDAHIVVTMPNADTGGGVLFDMIKDFVARHPGRACAHDSLGQHRHLSALAHVDRVVGNSSSGLIEAPAFKIGTVNIGARQDGRLKAASVSDCPAERGAIAAAIERILDPEYRAGLAGLVNPYGEGGASARTVAVIEDWMHGERPKRFHDMPWPKEQVS